MNYGSTRGGETGISASRAIVQGLSGDGGLFVPELFPAVDIPTLLKPDKEPYHRYAERIAGAFLEDYGKDTLAALTKQAYGMNFDRSDPAPVKKLRDGFFFTELFHGPTLAFKDIALQLMPLLFTEAKRVNGMKNHSLILVATSGDTGKAALEGYKDVPGVSVAVFYPQNGVSEIQRTQMMTQEGGNVFVAGVDGNFDDTQQSVKALMTDGALIRMLAERNIAFSSANSINLGRLLPQIVYYFTTYASLVRSGEIAAGDPVNFAVPSGNFGNILAGYYAKRMGLPVKKLIAASNQNDVLTEFVNTGTYNASRPFFTTLSPSMDILVSSNVERLVYAVTGNDAARTNSLFSDLRDTGSFRLDATETTLLNTQFSGYCCDDAATKRRIRETFSRDGYLIDPHTAVGLEAAEAHRETGDDTPVVIIATASPYKFAGSVLAALGSPGFGGEAALERLSAVTGTPVPSALSALHGKAVRFDGCFKVSEQRDALLSFINTIQY